MIKMIIILRVEWDQQMLFVVKATKRLVAGKASDDKKQKQNHLIDVDSET